MSGKKELSQIEKAIKYAGLVIIVILYLAHVFKIQPIEDPLIFLLPAIMIGIDLSNFLKK